MLKNVIYRTAALTLAAAVGSSVAVAQQRHFGGGPAAPHFSAPHFNAAPHFSAPPHFSAAPRFNVAPHVSTAPRFNAPRAAFMPRGHASTPQNVTRQTFHAPSITRHAVRGETITRHAVRGQTVRRSASVSRDRFVGRNASRNVLRTAQARTQLKAEDRVGSRRLAGTNIRPSATGRNITLTKGADSVLGGQIAASRGPLGARNMNFAERHGFFADRRKFFHRGGFIGWFGPVFWPYAYDDLFDYAFWPYDYDDYGFWAYAYDGLLDSVFWAPAPEDLHGYASVDVPERRHVRSRHVRADIGIEQTYRAATQICQTSEPSLIHWPIDQIAQTVQPIENQQQLLDNLRTGSEKASNVLQAACPTNQPITPLGRLDIITSRLEAMLQAADIVRPALASFYDSLDDEQKGRFNEMGQEPGRSAKRGGGAEAKSEARVCAGQAPGVLSEQAVRRIDQKVRPNERQSEALNELRDASTKAAEDLRDACPSDTPLTPIGRLDAMTKRLQAMLDAAKSVRPALARFYDLLNDEQKARFNAMSPQES